MRKLILAVLLITVSCTKPDTGLTTSVQVPPLPENLAQRAGKLEPLSDTSMGAQVTDNTFNIRQYNSVANQLNNVIDLYNCVKDSVNNKKEFKCP